jgi:predicted RNA-binding Zn-ribbon protein involved in translation (DUF1610 family)
VTGQDPAIGSDGVRMRVRLKRRAFRCRACGSEWVATYEVRDYLGPTGTRWIVHCRDGIPVPAPMFGDRCPTCGRVSIMFDIEAPASPASVALDAAAR